MVMRRNMMRRNLTRSICRSLGRYIAIVAIIALGCALFVGLKITKTDMIATGQDYTDKQNMFDLCLLNTYGWSQEQVDAMAGLKGVQDAEGSIYLDAYADVGNGDNEVFRFYSIPQRINKVYLISGRMPQASNECLVDSEYFPEEAIGSTITITSDNEAETMKSLTEHSFTVVGRISSPLYMDMTRGSTSLGSGSLTTYIYLPEEAFDVDYYTELYVTIPGDWAVYTQVYTDELDEMVNRMETDALPLTQHRFQTLLADAQKEYSDGLAEYENGLVEFEEGKAEALQALEDARKELEAAQTEIEENRQTILDAEKQIEQAQQQLDEGRTTLEASRVELENAKAEAYNQMAAAYTELLANYKLVSEGLAQVNDGLVQIDDGLMQIDDGLAQIRDSLPLLELMIQLTQTQVDVTKAALDAAEQMGDTALAERLRSELNEKTVQLLEYQTQLDTAKQTQLELETTRAQLITQRAELKQTQTTLLESMDAINMGFVELETNESVAENQFAAAQAQINAGLLELEAGQAELDAKKLELQSGKSQLLEGEQQLADGWAEYEKGKAEADAELAEAEAELADAKIQLEDARKIIDEMAEPELFVLTRNTNAGYTALDSNSDIVSGIAKVLPVFFILIAALVCITTITRMVEEERTQIGTLKALGHSNTAIMSKYLWYSASAAIIGCTIGVLVGSTFFPMLLWNAYGIIFNIRPDVVLTVDWSLSLGITGAYLVVSTLVTWYCCRRTLREVPAQLIRPKAPAVGKKVLLEYMPFWKRLSFLNKVMLRNVVRYKQRLLMMIIGIGGCTALLLTGFGMNDTIVGIADMQFEKVNHFDIQVYFSDGRTQEEQDAFAKKLREQGITDHVGFFYQSSAKLHFDSQARDVYLIAADSQIVPYMTFQRMDQDIPLPEKDEALISIGVSEILDIGIGDTITVRNTELDSMTLTVAGIYENHLNNYVIVSPETIQEQWQTDALPQMAFLMVREGKDVHSANSLITQMDGVMTTTVCEDIAEMFSSMMDALGLVILVAIVSAGLLGAIVLYNLTNININERIREIATIKVLGFNASETSAYVFKENILLTVLGVIFGLPLGKWFLGFVMDHIKIDIVWFNTQAAVLSYFWAVLLTLLCATLVDFIFHHKLQKINMAEALKSVE